MPRRGSSPPLAPAAVDLVAVPAAAVLVVLLHRYLVDGAPVLALAGGRRRWSGGCIEQAADRREVGLELRRRLAAYGKERFHTIQRAFQRQREGGLGTGRFPVGMEKYLTLRNYTLLHNRL